MLYISVEHIFQKRLIWLPNEKKYAVDKKACSISRDVSEINRLMAGSSEYQWQLTLDNQTS